MDQMKENKKLRKKKKKQRGGVKIIADNDENLIIGEMKRKIWK